MDADQVSLKKLIKMVYQFKVPLYQRPYSWDIENCEKLWDDILHAGQGEKAKQHFVGCIVCINEGSVQWDQPVLIIDGQQRITTVMLLLEAMARGIEDHGKDFDVAASSLRNNLIDHERTGEAQYKIILSRDDKAPFIALMNRIENDGEGRESRILKNFRFFEKKVNALSEEDAKKFNRGLMGLQVVSILLDHEDDEPQDVFESMNSKGKDLSSVDLVRNYMLMKLPPSKQEKLYSNYWHPMEALLQSDEDGVIESFFRDYLIASMGKGVAKNSKALYADFKNNRKKKQQAGVEHEGLFKEMRQYGEYYSRFACNKEQKSKLRNAFRDFQGININVASFLLLSLYEKYDTDRLDEEGFVKITRLIESYVFRRWACGLQPNARHTAFVELIQKINNNEFDGKGFCKEIAEYFIELDDAKRFPQDHEFKEGLVEKRIYDARGKINYCKYILDRLEHHDRREGTKIERPQIEHVMPQRLSSEWKEYLGEDWKDIHDKYLDRLCNLTITGYNQKYSNKLFLEKRDMEDGFKDSPLWLNKRLAKTEAWNKEAMEERGRELAEKAVEVWISAESLAGDKK